MTDVATSSSNVTDQLAQRHGDRGELRLDHVTMIRRGLTLVEDLSVTVIPGQTLAVTGASGAGKTTLLRAISGLSDTDSGSVSRPTGGLAQVFQEPRLMPWYPPQHLPGGLRPDAGSDGRPMAGKGGPRLCRTPPADPALRRYASAGVHRPGAVDRAESAPGR